MANTPRFFILTGDPGVGKTTLTKKLALSVQDKGYKTLGFYTEEMRRNGIREGFDIITLDGTRGRLARDQSLLKDPVKFKVGKYGVLLQEFENIALSSLSTPDDKSLLVIDEIGKMELFSEAFRHKIKEIFSLVSKTAVLATIPIRKGDQLVESIRNNSQAKVWTITRNNRNRIHEDILNEMETALNFN